MSDRECGAFVDTDSLFDHHSNAQRDGEMAAVVDMGTRSRRQTISDSDSAVAVRSANRPVVGPKRRAHSFRQQSSLSLNCDIQPEIEIHDHDECPLLNEASRDSSTAECSPKVQESTVSYTPYMRDRMRRKIKYSFMNPVEKWRTKGKFPWKLFVQIVKIVIITMQICLYGVQMSRHITHQGNVVTTFRELFLQNWDAVREVMAYPPSAGPYAIYTRNDFYSYIDLTVKALSNISTQAIGTFGYSTNSSDVVSPITFCRKHFAKGSVDPSTFTFNYDTKIVNNCTRIDVTYPAGDNKWNSFSSKDYFDKNNINIMFERLLVARVSFDVRLIYINSLESKNSPQCYESTVVLRFDNTLHDGQMLVSLDAENIKHNCNGNISDSSDALKLYISLILNVISIILCALSLTLCAISLYKGFRLRKEVTDFFLKYFGHELSWSERNEFIDIWIVTIIINDIFIIIGSLMETQVEYRQNESYHYNVSAILLGVGILLVWVGVLRYLSFFQKYNILILTLKRAIPDVLRFMLCAVILYGGFCICGWVVLGPYHIKFRTLSTTSECLFSLLNGDDMFATFAILDEKNELVWWFSRLYLYLFIALFIYVVLSLFISVIMDSYETIKEYYEHGFPLTDLQRFIAECPDDPMDQIYRMEAESRRQNRSWRNCFHFC